MSSEGDAANGRPADGSDIKSWMKQRNDYVGALRQSSARPVRTSSSTPSASGRPDPSLTAGDLANIAGLAAGAVRGGVRLAEEVGRLRQTAQHMLDPFYGPLHPTSPPVTPLYQAVVGALRAGKDIALHPAHREKRR